MKLGGGLPADKIPMHYTWDKKNKKDVKSTQYEATANVYARKDLNTDVLSVVDGSKLEDRKPGDIVADWNAPIGHVGIVGCDKYVYHASKNELKRELNLPGDNSVYRRLK